jgi:hypothetical protein
MKDSHIHAICTISSRYSEVHSNAKFCKNALKDLKFSLFSDLLNDAEIDLLNESIRLIELLEQKTNYHACTEYIKNL